MLKSIVSIIITSILMINTSGIDERIPDLKFYLKKDEGQVVFATSENFEEEVLKNDKIVLLNFYADWCKPCNEFGPVLEEFARNNIEYSIVKVDVDKQRNLKEQYEIKGVPTTIIIINGKEESREAGFIEYEELITWVESAKNSN